MPLYKPYLTMSFQIGRKASLKTNKPIKCQLGIEEEKSSKKLKMIRRYYRRWVQ